MKFILYLMIIWFLSGFFHIFSLFKLFSEQGKYSLLRAICLSLIVPHFYLVAMIFICCGPLSFIFIKYSVEVKGEKNESN